MLDSPITLENHLPGTTFWMPLPGPDRKRTRHPYIFRTTYCNRQPGAVGCTLTWEVLGGRLVYQIALERQNNGQFQWHCTCADSVYRGEKEGKICKHVHGLMALGRPGGQEG